MQLRLKKCFHLICHNNLHHHWTKARSLCFTISLPTLCLEIHHKDVMIAPYPTIPGYVSNLTYVYGVRLNGIYPGAIVSAYITSPDSPSGKSGKSQCSLKGILCLNHLAGFTISSISAIGWSGFTLQV